MHHASDSLRGLSPGAECAEGGAGGVCRAGGEYHTAGLMSEAGVTQGAPHPEGLCPELASTRSPTSDRDKHAAASPGITTYCGAPFPAGQPPPEFAILPPSDQTLCLQPSTERYDASPTILRIRYLLIAADDASIRSEERRVGKEWRGLCVAEQ